MKIWVKHRPVSSLLEEAMHLVPNTGERGKGERGGALCGLVVLTVCPKFSLTILNSDHLFPFLMVPTSVLLGNSIILAAIQRKWPWAGNLEPRFLVLALPLGKSPFLSLGLSLQ